MKIINKRYKLKLHYKTGLISEINDFVSKKDLIECWDKMSADLKKNMMMAQLVTYEDLELK